VKQNQHQAGGKNNRAAKSKQARKNTGANTATSAADSARRRPLSADHAKSEVEIVAYIQRQPRGELENTARGFFAASPESLNQAFLEITRGELNAVMRFCMKLKHLPTVAAGELQLSLLSELRRRLDDTSDRASGLFLLFTAYLEREAYATVSCVKPSGAEAAGVMGMAHDVTRSIETCSEVVQQVWTELGGMEMARARVPARREEEAAKGGAR